MKNDHDIVLTVENYLWIALLGLALLLFPVQALSQVELVEEWRLEQALDMPESVAFDPGENALFVTNIQGDPSEKDGNGYLTRVSMEGEVASEQWVSGLHAPKGIAVHDGSVYVADIDELIEIDAATGEIVERYPAGNAEFLNDVTVDNEGRVYVSDSNTHTVYRLANGTFSVWMQGPQIKAPNGVFAEPEHLIVAACTFDLDDPGGSRHFQYVAYGDQHVEIPQGNSPMGNIDGIKPDGNGGYFITEWRPGTLSHYDPEEGVHLLRELGQGAADLEYIIDRNLLFVPVMMSDRLIAFRVE